MGFKLAHFGCYEGISMKRYICIEAFPLRTTVYERPAERDRWVNVGDAYILVKEPTPERKLYELKRYREKPLKFEEPTIKLRKSELRQLFKEDI